MMSGCAWAAHATNANQTINKNRDGPFTDMSFCKMVKIIERLLRHIESKMNLFKIGNDELHAPLFYRIRKQ
jgi:hypothetical protein